jgi:dTDP-4-amino-4,6-dideoxygalactose transaminase
MTQGPYADEFEEGFTALTGAEHAITVTSCTTGMEVTLEALGIGEGDEVVVPSFTYPATASVVVRQGATPVLVDVDPETYNIDVDQLQTAVTTDTAAVIPVSWGGQPLDPDPITDIAADNDLVVVEDAACGAGASFDDNPVGSQFDASVFSFHPRKVLAVGEGGMITTDNDDLAEDIRTLKNFGMDQSAQNRGFVRSDGTNLRYSDVLAAIGVAQLDKLQDVVRRRREIATRYDELLSDVEGVETPFEPKPATHTYQSYAIKITAGSDGLRDELIDRLGERDIQTQIGTYALHETPAFENCERGGPLESAALLHDNLLTLPVAHSMSDADIERVVTTLQAELQTVCKDA